MQDSQHLLPSSGAKHEIIRSTSITMRQNQYEEPWKPISGLPISSQLVQIESTVKKPVLIDVQGLPDHFWMLWFFEENFRLFIHTAASYDFFERVSYVLLKDVRSYIK